MQQFVKSGVYVQKFTEKGISEQEIDTRDPHERADQERLKKLPEFSQEQLQEVEQNEANEIEFDTTPYSYVSAPVRYVVRAIKLFDQVSVDDLEYLETLERQEKRSKDARLREEEQELIEFRKSQGSVVIRQPVIESQDERIPEASGQPIAAESKSSEGHLLRRSLSPLRTPVLSDGIEIKVKRKAEPNRGLEEKRARIEAPKMTQKEGGSGVNLFEGYNDESD